MRSEEAVGVRMRRYAFSDGPRCAQIFLQGRRDAFPWQPPDFFRLSDFYDCVSDDLVWVAEVKGDVVGFLSANPTTKSVENIFVDAHWRKRGVGRCLMLHALYALGEDAAQVRCVRRHTAGQAFFQRTGWVVDGMTADGDAVVFRRC